MLAEESTNWLNFVAEGDAHVEMQSFKQNGLSLTRSLQWHCELVWIRLPELFFFLDSPLQQVNEILPFCKADFGLFGN